MSSRSPWIRRSGGACALVALALLGGAAAGPAHALDADVPQAAAATGWRWPMDGFALVRAFAAPAHRYGPGHRGVDLLPADGSVVRAPARGVVAFAGVVAGRGVVTIAHPGDLVSTLEPVVPTVAAGDAVRAGDPVGAVGAGGHVLDGAVHFGVRLHGEYVNPMLLLGGVPRAVLLPCCS